MKTAFEELGIGSGYTRADIDKIGRFIIIMSSIGSYSLISAGISFSYSAADGIIIMNHLDKLLNSRGREQP